MNAIQLSKNSRRYLQVMPIYLGIQATILLLTYLDSPVFIEAYQRQGNLTVGGWVGVWFILEIFGLASGLAFFISPTWRASLSEQARVKIAAGFLLGAAAGLLSLGLRFMPLMPPAYFWATGSLVVLSAAGLLAWSQRRQRQEDLFP